MFSASDLVTVIDGHVLNDQAATDAGMVEQNLNELGGSSREFLVTAKSIGNGTAPGGSKTFTVNLYWSDVSVAVGSVAAQLADRKQVLTAKTFANSVSITKYWECSSGAGILRKKAKYLYISVDASALDADATETLDVYLQFIPSTAPLHREN